MAKDNQPKEKKTGLPSIIEIIGALSGLVVLFGIIFWLAGKSYIDGYLAILTIPVNHISFQADDYRRLGWLALIPNILEPLVPVFRVSVLLMLILYLISIGLKNSLSEEKKAKLTRGLNSVKEIFSVPDVFRILFKWLLTFVIVILVASFLYLRILLVLDQIAHLGEATGKDYMLTNTQVIELVSRTPLELGKAELTAHPSDDLESSIYIYKGFRLLTYSEGKYYLFKELDPQSCKPKEVYIIDEKELVQVKVFPGSPIDIECTDNETTSEPVQPTEVTPSITP